MRITIPVVSLALVLLYRFASTKVSATAMRRAAFVSRNAADVNINNSRWDFGLFAVAALLVLSVVQVVSSASLFRASQPSSESSGMHLVHFLDCCCNVFRGEMHAYFFAPILYVYGVKHGSNRQTTLRRSIK